MQAAETAVTGTGSQNVVNHEGGEERWIVAESERRGGGSSGGGRIVG